MRPDLAQIQDALSCMGLTFDRLGSEEKGFACQCPVHQGDGKSARFAIRNGILLFTCYAYGCDFRDVKDALDLTDGDCYADHILRDRARQRPQMVSDAQAFVVVAENDIAQGKRLSDKDLSRYRQALIQQHRGVA